MKDKIMIITFTGFLFTMMLLSFLTSDKEYSTSERRKLKQFPNLVENTSLNKNYFQELDQYLIDQFPFRDQFRTVKAWTEFQLVQKKDYNGVFLKNDHIFELNQKQNQASLTYFTNKLNEIKERYLKKQPIYYAIIPDKNYYLKDKTYPRLDDQLFLSQIQNNLDPEFTYIDLWDCLSLDSYYRTDIHWKQEKIEPVVEKLLGKMQVEKISRKKTNHIYESFYGSLSSKLALSTMPDTLVYQTTESLDQITVFNWEKQRTEPMYQQEYLTHPDAYDIFLGGATPLLTITNENQPQGKELIIFRDSFASSLTPLMIESYHTITLIDLRYMNSHLLETLVDFDQKDVLFLYSVPVINQSFSLK